jgi:hypothetical protein
MKDLLCSLKKSLLSFFQISISCPKAVILRKVYYDAKQWGERSIFLAVENDSCLRTLLRTLFEYFLRDFFPERKQS